MRSWALIIVFAVTFSVISVSGLAASDPSTQTYTINSGSNRTIVADDGASYTVKVIGVSGSANAVVSVNGESMSVTKKTFTTIGGLTLYIRDMFYLSSTDQSQNSVQFGFNIQTIISGQNITLTSVDGTQHVAKVLGVTVQAAAVSVDGESRTIAKGDNQLVGNVLVYVKDILYLSTTDQSQNSAALGFDVDYQTACTDTDGGINYNVKGTTIHGNVSSVDWCSTNTSAGIAAAQCSGADCTLVEHYCRPPNEGTAGIATQFYNCPYGCRDGACLVSAPNQTTCTDSDGGKNAYVKGTLIATGAQSFNSTDYCATTSGNPSEGYIGTTNCYGNLCYVAEFFCTSANQQNTEMIQCPNGCRDGACLQSNQSDNCKYDGADGVNIGNIFAATQDACYTYWDSFGSSRPGSKVYYYGHLIKTYQSQNTYCGDGKCESPERITMYAGTDRNTTVYGIRHTAKLLGVSSATSAAISIDGVAQTVAKGAPYTISGVPLIVDGIYFSSSTDQSQNSAVVAFGEGAQTCPGDCAICTNKCGDGVCNEFVCYGTGCPCVETAANCPKDCGIQETCSDTDGGKDLLKKGIVSYWRPGYSQTFNDWCFSDYRYIMEYWCGKDVSPTGTGMTSMSFACPEGYMCRDGACMQSAIPYGCPSSVYIAFDRNEYSFGDTVYVKVGVWDVNSRGLPNARVWVEGKYNGVPMGLSTLTTDEHGQYYSNSTVGSMQQGVYEYTATYNESGCPSISAGTKIVVYNTTAQACKESDGGIDYYTQGTTEACSSDPHSTCKALMDSCSSSTTIMEGYCSGNDVSSVYYECPSGCRDGACAQSTNVTQVGFRKAYWQCYDGKEANEGGETSCKTSETWQKYAEEFCKGRCEQTKCEATATSAVAATATRTTAVAYEAASPSAGGGGGTSVPTSTQTPAPSAGGGGGTSVKCIGGKCGVASFRVSNECDTGTASGECKDSDGGKDAYAAGKTWMGNNVQEDACYDKNVIEYYCSYDSATNTEFIKKDEIPCPTGCSGGACINEKKDDCRANGYYCASTKVGCGEEGRVAASYKCEWADEVCCSSKPPQYEERIKLKIDKGWNLISIPGTFSVDRGTCSQPEKWAFFWWYAPEKRFVGMKDVEKLQAADWDFKKAAFWAYSPENCQMEFRVSASSEYYSVDDLPKLYAGWNMVAITKDMLGSKLDDFNGDCEVKGAYVFDGMKWKIMGEQVVPASLEALGHGMAINVANDCRLGVTGITPPAFPTGMMIAV